jgi:manganese transport protein
VTRPTALQRVRGRGRVRGSVALLGPAFVAAIAYVDPGNFATNVSAGAEFGYLLVWVIVLANLMAMLIQSLSGKVGAGHRPNLPELCRSTSRGRSPAGCGCRPSWWRWPPTWPR